MLADLHHTADPEEETDAPDEGGLANSTVFLALYLILLGFFILLNAHASLSEAKTRAMVDGLRLDFVPPVPQPEGAMALVADPLEQRLADLFRHELPDGGWQLETREGTVIVRMPQRRAFTEDSAVLQPGRISMVQRLSALLGEAQKSNDLNLSLTLFFEHDRALARRRAAALARDLVRNGISHERFRLVIKRGADDDVVMHLMPAAAEGS
ncbi:hypothetical protein [Minwuia sp.]|uniref:hypothetical protein n=1 Tax=Minwuia sp. TaxID=2493630 RepID=UPI003A923E15